MNVGVMIVLSFLLVVLQAELQDALENESKSKPPEYVLVCRVISHWKVTGNHPYVVFMRTDGSLGATINKSSSLRPIRKGNDLVKIKDSVLSCLQARIDSNLASVVGSKFSTQISNFINTETTCARSGSGDNASAAAGVSSEPSCARKERSKRNATPKPPPPTPVIEQKQKVKTKKIKKQVSKSVQKLKRKREESEEESGDNAAPAKQKPRKRASSTSPRECGQRSTAPTVASSANFLALTGHTQYLEQSLSTANSNLFEMSKVFTQGLLSTVQHNTTEQNLSIRSVAVSASGAGASAHSNASNPAVLVTPPSGMQASCAACCCKLASSSVASLLIRILMASCDCALQQVFQRHRRRRMLSTS